MQEWDLLECKKYKNTRILSNFSIISILLFFCLYSMPKDRRGLNEHTGWSAVHRVSPSCAVRTMFLRVYVESTWTYSGSSTRCHRPDCPECSTVDFQLQCWTRRSVSLIVNQYSYEKRTSSNFFVSICLKSDFTFISNKQPFRGLFSQVLTFFCLYIC